MTDPRDIFVSRIDIAKTRLKPFDGFLFLCGGATSVEAIPLRSVRHLIDRELTAGRYADLIPRLKLAEDIQDWFRDGMYKDLVTFEAHLAGLSSVIVLVLESAGSIAELGSFAVTDAIRERLLVLIGEVHYEQESFIRLGPIRRLENNSDKSVLVYDWHEARPLGGFTENPAMLEAEVGVIVGAIREFHKSDVGEKVFKFSEPSHVMLLICELCDLFGALSQREIKGYLARLNPESSHSDVDQYLFLLTKCELLRIKSKSHGRYYFTPDWQPRFSFAFNSGDRVDRDRILIDVLKF